MFPSFFDAILEWYPTVDSAYTCLSNNTATDGVYAAFFEGTGYLVAAALTVPALQRKLEKYGLDSQGRVVDGGATDDAEDGP